MRIGGSVLALSSQAKTPCPINSSATECFSFQQNFFVDRENPGLSEASKPGDPRALGSRHRPLTLVRLGRVRRLPAGAVRHRAGTVTNRSPSGEARGDPSP